MQTYDEKFLKKPLEELQNSVTAAVIGISKLRWEFAKSEDAELARLQMKRHKFDVLPINVSPSSYFRTKFSGDYSSIQKFQITSADKIPASTDFLKLLKLFSEHKREFFFLQENSEIVGLVSLTNLNCREVKAYLFVTICEFEILLCRSLDVTREENEVLDLNGKTLDSLISLVGKRKIYENWEISKYFGAKETFSTITDGLVGLRNGVAHQTSVLVGDLKSCKKLERTIWSMLKIVEILRRIVSSD